MFTKENIIIQKDILGILNPKCDMIDYEKNTNDLYELITKIIEELHIISKMVEQYLPYIIMQFFLKLK